MLARETFEELKTILENHQYSDSQAINFLETEDLLNDNYRLNEAGEIQREFMSLAQAYLKESYPGQFGIFRDWCVHICTANMIKECGLSPRYIID